MTAASNSEARKRANEAASVAESGLSQPILAPVDSGAIGRLNERQTVDALLACLPMHEDGTGHIADCGYDWEITAPCGCYTLPERLAVLLREHTDRALTEHRHEWADYFEHWSGAVGPEPLTVASVIQALRAESVPFGRAARQEQGR